MTPPNQKYFIPVTTTNTQRSTMTTYIIQPNEQHIKIQEKQNGEITQTRYFNKPQAAQQYIKHELTGQIDQAKQK